MKVKNVEINLFSTRVTFSICVLKNIKNPDLKSLLPSLNCALINPKLICSYDQLTTALMKTINGQLNNSMKTRVVYTELLYNLSPSTNVTESLKTFGIDFPSHTSAIAIRLNHPFDAPDFASELEQSIDCEATEFSLDSLTAEHDWPNIINVYKLTCTEYSEKAFGEICTIISTKNI